MKRTSIYFLSFFTIFILIFIVLWCLYQLIFGSWLLVREVTIIADPQIISDPKIFDRPQNLLLLSETNLSKQIVDTFPYVKAVQIEKKFPHELKIKVIPRTPLVLVVENGQNLFLDEDGKLLKFLPKQKQTSIPFLDCKVQDPQLLQILALVQSISVQENGPKKISCTDPQLIKLSFNETEFWFDIRQDKDKVVTSLLFLLKQFRIEGKYPKIVDLRFEKPVLMPEGIKEASPASSSG